MGGAGGGLDPCAVVDPGPCCIDGQEGFATCEAQGDRCECACPAGATEGACVDVCPELPPAPCCLNAVEQVDTVCRTENGECVCACPGEALPGACDPCAADGPPLCCIDGVEQAGVCRAEGDQCICECPGGQEGRCGENPCNAVDPGPCCRNGVEQLFADCRPEGDQCVCMCPAGTEPGFCDGPPECSNPAFDPDCRNDLDQAACEANGGRFGAFGLNPEPSCQCPTQDGGCACTGDGQCQGACMAPFNDGGGCDGILEGMCAAVQPQFGCFCVIFAPGEAAGLCVD